MAGKIKKGFTSYLVVLLIALVAAFLICVTIMLFSPFKNILGFQYFIYNSSDYVYNVTNAENKEVFDFSKIEEIKVNCNYANVAIKRSNRVDSHAIVFENKTKGFAREDQDTGFAYEIFYEDAAKKVLKVEVKEPEGFLYFNKDITINIFVPTEISYSFENTKINITNTSGNIYLGNSEAIKAEGNNIIDINDLSIKTNSGDIILFQMVDTDFEDVFIKTVKGEVDFRKDIKVSNELKVYSSSAEINFGAVEAKNILLDLGNAKFSTSNIKGNVELYINKGYFDVAKIDGNLVSNDANAQMGAAAINIKEITGTVSLPFANASRINIDKLSKDSEFYAEATSGSINIGETYGEVYIETTSGSVNVHTFADDIQIKTISGNINVVYDNSTIADQLDFYTEKGKVSLKIKSDLAFKLAIYKTDLTIRGDDKITIDWMKDKFENPLTVNGGTKNIIIYANNNVNISLLDLA